MEEARNLTSRTSEEADWTQDGKSQFLRLLLDLSP